MKTILIAGAGKVGSLIAGLLQQEPDYRVVVVDQRLDGVDISRLQQTLPHLQLVATNIQQPGQLAGVIQQHDVTAVVSCLPYYANPMVAQVARECSIHYFDLTEDIAVTQQIADLAAGATTVFMPQCGLAPGFVNIVAHSLMQEFTRLDKVMLRVGALPQCADNALHYALTWSLDGLINQYANPCRAIVDGQEVMLTPLADVTPLILDGCAYEAFNTSGGLGSLAQTYAGKIQHLRYQTLRYPGHAAKMAFLMQELGLKHNRPWLKQILQTVLPTTYQDVVVIAVMVQGWQQERLVEQTYCRKFYPREIAGLFWSALQVTTAAGVCALLDIVLQQPTAYRGWLVPECFTLKDILQNRFGVYYQ